MRQRRRAESIRLAEDTLHRVPVRPKLRRVAGLTAAAMATTVVALNWTWGRLPPKPPAPPGSRFLSIDKVRIRYVDHPGTGIPVLFIHGQPGSTYDFDPVRPFLAGHRVITYDRPGYGWSTGGYHRLAVQVAAIHALLAHLRVDRVVIVGHSYGGTIALAYAEAYPDQVAGLVLVAAAAGGIRSNALELAQARGLQVLGLPVISTLADVTFSQLLRTVAGRIVEAQAFSPRRTDPAELRDLLRINMTRGTLDAVAGESVALDSVVTEVDRRLASLHMPTIVIQGRSDRIVPERFGRTIAMNLPDSRLEMLTGGHMQLSEHPEAIARAVTSLEDN